MHFILTILIFMLYHGTNIAQVNYFVNKEMYDAILRKDKHLLLQKEGKINAISLLI